ncbi:MAG: enolase C-terminal domain-like protein [Acidimicrobiales bacterium]
MKLTLWRDDVTLARALSAADERHEVRPRLYLEVDDGAVCGYGEVGAQPIALHGDPSVDDVIAELCATVLPLVARVARREGALPNWTRAVRLGATRATSRFAVALVEMALLDVDLRRAATTLAQRWPARYAPGALLTVSLLDDAPWPSDADAARLRVKTRPGPLSAASRERLASVTTPVLLDFNASGRSLDQVADHVDQVAGVATLVAVEQPFAPGNLPLHAALARRLAVAVSLDEGVRSAADLDRIARYGAATMVCLKPARVGGLSTARTLAARAGDLGLAAYLGGFFESDFARAVHGVLVRHAVSEPSDLAPVGRRDRDDSDARVVADGLGVAPLAAVLARARLVVSLG